MYIGKIDYGQPRLGFEGLPELERYANYFDSVHLLFVSAENCWT